MTSRLTQPVGRPGAIALPEDVGEDYYRQLASEVREVIDGAPVWTKVSEDNHWFDCEALAAAAGRLLNAERIPEGAQRDWDETAPAALVVKKPTLEGEPTPEPDPAPIAPPVPAPPPKSLRESLSARMAARAQRFNGR